MKRNVITISEGGAVNVPTNVEMTDFEIAQLLEVIIPSVRGCIKRLLKSRVKVDCSGAEVSGNKIVPTHFGLEVVIAIAFQVDSYKAEIFRRHILHRTMQPPIYIKMKEGNEIYN